MLAPGWKMPSMLPLKWRSHSNASKYSLEYISTYCRIFWELSWHKEKFSPCVNWCGAYLTHSSVSVTEVLSAFTSPDVLEERTDLKGGVTPLSGYANVIGESHRALKVNHSSDVCRNAARGYQLLFFFLKQKGSSLLELQSDAVRIPAALCEFLNWCTSSDFNYQLISRFEGHNYSTVRLMLI